MTRSLVFASAVVLAVALLGCSADKDRDKNKKDLPDLPRTPDARPSGTKT